MKKPISVHIIAYLTGMCNYYLSSCFKSCGNASSESMYTAEATCYECEDCGGCPYKKQCTRAKGNRKLQVSKNFIRQRAEYLEQITSEKGILLRMNRSIQSEGECAVLKQNHAKIQQNRAGRQLFGKLSA